MTKKILTTALLGFGFSTLFAQLNGSVNVEGEYAPIIIETERLNTFPLSYKFELPSSTLSYDMQGVITDFKPDLLTMGAVGRQTGWLFPKRSGYLDFRLGSFLDSGLDAGYYCVSDARNTLLATLNFESTSLFRPHGFPEAFTKPARKQLYDGRLGFDYSRIVDNDGLFNASIGYRLGYFNYYGTSLPLHEAPEGFQAPSQTLNQVDASASFRSSASFLEGWNASGSVKYTGFRRLYLSEGKLPDVAFSSTRGARETDLSLGGGYIFTLGETSALSIDASGRFLFIGKNHDIISYTGNTEARNYGIVTLNPAFRFAKPGLILKAGLNVAVSYDAMGTSRNKDFGLLHLSPDVRIAYRSQAGIGLNLSVTGGVTPTTLALREEFNRYQIPMILSTCPVYSPLDARMSFDFGPFAGFAGEASFRYAIARNTPIGGWYQAFLGTYLHKDSFMPNGAVLLDPFMQTVNLHGLSVGLDLQYSYGSFLTLEFNGVYTPQKGKTGIFNGFDRPRWELIAKAGVRPLKRFHIEFAYDYRGVRNCYGWSGPEAVNVLKSYRLMDISNLKAKISYNILDNLSVYCQGDNLLNRHVELLPGLQSEGILVSGGLYVEF